MERRKFNSKNKGYNCTDGGDGRTGSSPSIKTRQKLSAFNKGKNAGKRNPFYGRKHSLKTRAHWSRIRKGRKLTPEQVAKLIARLTGRVVSEETKAKIRASSKGRKLSPEHLASLRAALVWVPDNPQKLISLYVSGCSLRELEDMRLAERHTIVRFLKKSGIAIRTKSQQQKLTWKKRNRKQ